MIHPPTSPWYSNISLLNKRSLNDLARNKTGGSGLSRGEILIPFIGKTLQSSLTLQRADIQSSHKFQTLLYFVAIIFSRFAKFRKCPILVLFYLNMVGYIAEIFNHIWRDNKGYFFNSKYHITTTKSYKTHYVIFLFLACHKKL